MSNTNNQTLAERILKFEVALSDGSNVYAGSALQSGKGLEKYKKGREKLADDDKSAALVVIDTTVWGSVAEGFFITENHIYAKELFEEKVKFCIKNIHTILADEKEKKLIINNQSIKWLGDEITPKIQIIAKCIQEYLHSINTTRGAQQGFTAYIENLTKGLDNLHTTIFQWSLHAQRKVLSISSDNLRHIPSDDDVSFIERISIAASRSIALSEYKQLAKEAKGHINNLNNSVLVKQANKQCQEYDIDEINFSFNFGTGADENTDLSNGNWLENTDNALNKINECSIYLMDTICSLIKKLEAIKREALEDFE